MTLTDEQRDAVEYGENAVVVACPGSGKTQTLTAKVLTHVEEVRGSARRIACITYTNAAVHEMENRLRRYGREQDLERCEISTIHAFCLNNILRFFSHLLPGLEKRSLYVLPSDSDHYHEYAQETCEKFGLDGKDRGNFELLQRAPDGTPITPSGTGLTVEVAEYFWKRLGDDGYVDFPNIVYYSYALLRDYLPIQAGLAARYAWLLVDEFQDTSAIQVEILKLIHAHGRTRFFIVGDPHQSIFGFAGARPELLDEFSNHIGARSDFHLSGNFRCSPPIVEHAERLIPRTPQMVSRGKNAVYTLIPVHQHSNSCADAISQGFLPKLAELGIGLGDAAVLAPSWFKLLPLGKELRQRGIPVIGPGARPYRRSSHLIAPLAEQVAGYVCSKQPLLIHQIERELFQLICSAGGGTVYSVFSYPGRRLVYGLVREAKRIADSSSSGADWLRGFAKACTSSLVGQDFLSKEQCIRLSESTDDLVTEIASNLKGCAFSVEDMGLFASIGNSLRLLTMHKAKGREFDAVALIDVHDGKIPHFRAKSKPELDEQRRLFYVAITRARQFLVYITDSEDWRNKPSPFIAQVLSSANHLQFRRPLR